jgi:hypothetical protein
MHSVCVESSITLTLKLSWNRASLGPRVRRINSRAASTIAYLVWENLSLELCKEVGYSPGPSMSSEGGGRLLSVSMCSRMCVRFEILEAREDSGCSGVDAIVVVFRKAQREFQLFLFSLFKKTAYLDPEKQSWRFLCELYNLVYTLIS